MASASMVADIRRRRASCSPARRRHQRKADIPRHRTFVELVEDHESDVGEGGIVDQASGQDPLGDDHQAGGRFDRPVVVIHPTVSPASSPRSWANRQAAAGLPSGEARTARSCGRRATAHGAGEAAGSSSCPHPARRSRHIAPARRAQAHVVGTVLDRQVGERAIRSSRASCRVSMWGVGSRRFTSSTAPMSCSASTMRNRTAIPARSPARGAQHRARSGCRWRHASRDATDMSSSRGETISTGIQGRRRDRTRTLRPVPRGRRTAHARRIRGLAPDRTRGRRRNGGSGGAGRSG